MNRFVYEDDDLVGITIIRKTTMPKVGELDTTKVERQMDELDEYQEAGDKRIYFGADVNAAVVDWGKYNEHPDVLRKVLEYIKTMEERLGPVSSVYKLSSGRYVAVTFGNQLHIGAWINVGYLDHRIEFQGSVHQKGEVWRTDLLIGSGPKSNKKKKQEVFHRVCTEHFLQYPAHQSGCWICLEGN